jgi:hypothetical protein
VATRLTPITYITWSLWLIATGVALLAYSATATFLRDELSGTSSQHTACEDPGQGAV